MIQPGVRADDIEEKVTLRAIANGRFTNVTANVRPTFAHEAPKGYVLKNPDKALKEFHASEQLAANGGIK
ncbi:MAG: hypothetical protein H6861_05075 [Rhodospirillales bacterium]|nr:hypothetical protein [Rhodospirillales bacterium]